METLANLDVNVIQRIFQYLPLSDKLKLALLHPNFGAILKQAIGNEIFAPSDIEAHFSSKEADYLLSTYGPFIRRYEHTFLPDESATECFQLIRNYCTKLEEITFNRLEIILDSHEGWLLQQSKQLKKLNLKRCTVGNAVCSKLLARLSELQSLNLENSRITGKGLGELTNLIDLNLKNCRSLKGAHLIDVFKNNRLKRLNTVGFKQITNRTLEVLIETQDSIEKLELAAKGWAKHFERICTLKNLREVSMYNMQELDAADYLKVLVTEKMDSLECLEVNFRNIHTDQDTLFPESQIIKRICEFRNLRVLSIRSSALFDNPHLLLVGKACKHLEMLDLSGSSFTDVAIVNCLEYLRCLRYLDISYCRVKKNLYFRLVELRRGIGCRQPLIVYIKPQMDIASLLKSGQYFPKETGVWLSLDSMRPNIEDSLLDRLSHLNILHDAQNKSVLSESPIVSQDYCRLLQMDDYCLYHIVKHLTPMQRLNFLLTNGQFADIVKYSLRNDVIDLSSLIETFCLRDVRRLLERHSSVIRRLHIEFVYAQSNLEYVDLIAEFCTNLIELNWESVEETDRLLKILNASASTLENFRIANCIISDSFAFEMAKAHNVHTLTLCNIAITGIYLDTLTNLSKLDIRDCEEFENLAEICRSNRLSELNIEGCRKLNNDSFRILAETQKDLQRISLRGFYVATNMYALVDLTSLEHIKLVNCLAQESIDFLDAFCEHRSDQIKSLIFRYEDPFPLTLRLQLRKVIEKMKYLRALSLHYVGLSDADIISIVDKCSRLEIVDILYGDTVTNTGVLHPVKVLRELQHYNFFWFGSENIFPYYLEAVKIRKEKFPYGSMKMYMSINCIIDALMQTKEYSTMEKYISVSNYMSLDFDSIQKLTKVKPKSERIKTHTPSYMNTSTFNLLDLPNKCLTKIASYLQPIDRLKLVSLDRRFLNQLRPLLAEMTFDLNEISRIFTLVETKNLFRICGNLIERIRFASGYSEYLKLLQPYMENLVEIYFEGANFFDNEGCVEMLFSLPMNRLERLSFENCNYIGLVTKLANKNQLRYLLTTEWLSAESELQIDMKKFTNLKELHVKDCWSFSISSLKNVCEYCKLKALDLRETITVNEEVSRVLLETQNDCLEQLSVSVMNDPEFSEDIARLANLKHVTVEFVDFSWSCNVEKLVDKLIVYHAKDLLTLKIICTADYYVDYSWFQMIATKRCKFLKLETLDIDTKEPFCKTF